MMMKGEAHPWYSCKALESDIKGKCIVKQKFASRERES